jgi:hypothetical protein
LALLIGQQCLKQSDQSQSYLFTQLDAANKTAIANTSIIDEGWVVLATVRTACLLSLEAVDLNAVLLADALFNKDLADLGAMVALQLDDLAELFVLDNGAVAGKLLFEDL